MRKIIGFGETVLDIIFKNNQPYKAVPGGSTFNCMISLSRCNLPAFFLSEIGNDKVGDLIRKFMIDNGLTDQYLDIYKGNNSPVALAFLDDENNAEYNFYRDYPEDRINWEYPPVNSDDIIIFGSYFAVNPLLRNKVQDFLENMKNKNTIIYYDINFRKAHSYETHRLKTFFIENYEYSDIIRCSEEDLSVLYPGHSIDEIYQNYISFYTKNFIVTRKEKSILFYCSKFKKQYEVPAIDTTSTIGAGDNFNAGLIYGLYKYNILKSQLNDLSEEKWNNIIDLAILFSSEACKSYENYIPKNLQNL